MSTKSTLLLLPCCHIYNGYIGSNGESTLGIDISYGEVAEDSASVEVGGNSEFANLMRHLLKDKTKEELLNASKRGLNNG